MGVQTDLLHGWMEKVRPTDGSIAGAWDRHACISRDFQATPIHSYGMLGTWAAAVYRLVWVFILLVNLSNSSVWEE